jgi:hypothetical protein
MKPQDLQNIFDCGRGFSVVIVRGAITYRAWVRKGDGALEEAKRLRDEFVALAGPMHKGSNNAKPRSRSRSNTGVPGISETTTWKRSRPYPIFVVSWSEGKRRKTRSIIYGGKRTRRQAFELAVAQRRAIGAVIPEGAYAGM